MVAGRKSTAATDSGRALSPSERWFWIIDRMSPANCAARLRVEGRIPAGRLESAAAALVAEYPLLRMGISDDAGGDPWFRPLPAPRIPVRRIRSRAAEDWARVIDAEIAAPFDLANGSARITDIVGGADSGSEYHDIVLTVSHIIADGRSLLALLRKVIDYAADPTGPVAARPPVPAADDLIPRGARGIRRWAHTTLADQIGALVWRPRRLPGAVTALSERRTGVVHRVLGREALAALIIDCRRAGVTVHAALAAAVADGIGGAEPGVRGAAASRGRGVAGIGSPVDFRESLGPRVDSAELGVYAPVLVGFVPFGRGVSLWEAARAVKRQLDRGVRQGRHLATVAGMRFGTPRTLESGRRLAALVDRRAPWNVSVTNLGRVEFPEKAGAWRLSGLRVAASNSCVSVMTVAVTTAHAEMHLGFCYADPVVSRARAEAFADAVLGALARRPDPSTALQAGA
ncbi:phthiocerol/phthiodiolone dimycocerosyl transferase family protein [Nocardia sp. NPDC004582]